MTQPQKPQDTHELTSEDLALLAYLLEEEGIEADRQQIPPRRHDLEEIPLSFGQERLWFLDQLQPGSLLRKMSRVYQLSGPLDVPVLEQSLNELVRRHESLRTTFSSVDGRPVQSIAPSLTLRLPVTDLRGLPKSAQRDEVQRLVVQDRQQSFDLSEGPLLRTSLLKLRDEEHVLLLCIHHIVTDGWSMGILRRELGALYNTFSVGKPSPLPDLPIQYPDFALWQREWLQGEVLDRQLSYWRQQLEGAPHSVELPTDHPRPPVQTYRGGRQSLIIDEETTHALKALSQRENATLFMTLMAAFNVLLSRLSGQEDIVVGTPIAGRNRPQTEDLIGFFLNSLVLRTDLSGQPTFLQALRRARETALAAYDHQDVPFEKLLEELQPERDLSRTPFFQIFFNMVPPRTAPFALQGLSISSIPQKGSHANFDLTVYVSDLGDSVSVRFVYNADIFDQTRIAEMSAQYEHLLAQIANNPETRISQFSLVTPEAQEALPDPTLPLSDQWHGTIQTQVTLHAHQAPDHIAVLDAGERWTYHELDLWSNRLAHYLRAGGIQPQEVVAIYGHRSASLVWAILGVLKAGAAFLILDPAYPPARLAEYLRTARPRGWIQLRAAGDVPEAIQAYLRASLINCQLVVPGKTEAQSQSFLGAHPASAPGTVISPDDLAYVAFTSGSAGSPKGILGRHGPLTHFLPWQQETFGLSPADRFSMLSGLSHDPLQRDIFTALWTRATICIPDDDTIGTPGRLAKWMAREGITFAHLTPAMSQILTETAGNDVSLPSLRCAFFVGDKLTRTDVEWLTNLAPNVSCINSYGSTETQRAVGYFPVPPQDKDDRTRAVYPLGSGIPDVQLLVLTDGGRPAGVGELGEIHVRSPLLARGYLDDDALTRERFLASPFTRLDADQLYKTGDLGRYQPDGAVEFAGRDDHQVKMRGFRIELGEIEAVLRQHQGTREAVVLAREDQPGQLRLVAYIVPDQNPAPETPELRRLVNARLPDYMVPSAFVLLESLPLTPNGKLDRQALPPPDALPQALEPGYVAPRSPDEETLAGLWSQVLGIETVGVRDNFFELGGHSLLGVRLFALVNEEFDVNLPLAVLFQAPTIELLASVIREREGHSTATLQSLVPFRSAGTRPPLFAVPGNLGNVFVDLGHLSKYLDKNQPFYGLQDWTGNPVRIEALATAYIDEIQRAQPEGPYLLAGICSGSVVALEMAQQLRAQGQDVSLLAMVEPSPPHRRSPSTYAAFAVTLARQLRRRLSRTTHSLLQRPSRGQGEYIRLKLKVLGNRWALRRYVPHVYPGRIDLFLTERSLASAENRQLTWRNWALEGASIHAIPGNHATIVGLHDTPIEEAHMRALAEQVQTCIDEALAERGEDATQCST